MIALCIITPLILLAAIGAVWKARPVHAALLLTLPVLGVLVYAVTVGTEVKSLASAAD